MELNGATVSELAMHLDTPVSTVHDHLRTLQDDGYLVIDGKEYGIAVTFFELGGYARN